MHDTDEALIGHLYDALLHPEGLPEAITRMVQTFEGDTCHLVGWQGAQRAPSLSMLIGMHNPSLPHYVAHYAPMDPRRERVLNKYATGQVMACHEEFDARFVSGSEFYQDYLLPMGLHYTLASTVIRDESGLMQVAFQRFKGREPFSQEDKQRFARLMPHLQRVLRLTARLQQQAGQLAGAESALGACSVATVITNAHGRICHANSLAEALLQRGRPLMSLQGHLRLSAPRMNEWLLHSLQAVQRSGLPANQLIEVGPLGDRYSLTVMPLPPGHAPAYWLQDGGPHGELLCLISPLDRRRLATAKQLMDTFQLTAAEARLARALMAGQTLEQHAQAEGIQRSTVKTQLGRLMDKIGKNRQSELVRILSAMPAVRASM
jgi:DNA-binding CsgD family transcriptional regulator